MRDYMEQNTQDIGNKFNPEHIYLNVNRHNIYDVHFEYMHSIN